MTLSIASKTPVLCHAIAVLLDSLGVRHRNEHVLHSLQFVFSEAAFVSLCYQALTCFSDWS